MNMSNWMGIPDWMNMSNWMIIPNWMNMSKGVMILSRGLPHPTKWKEVRTGLNRVVWVVEKD